tara:strand:- start:2350 stop:3081 length:732 start_codon:yes stop_codon:yes gene_type:complete
MGDKSCYKLIGSLYDEDHTIHIYEDKLKRIRLKKWINKDGELHRLDGPAYIRQTFDEIPITKKWYEYGSLHREWGPAYKHYDKLGNLIETRWYKLGKLHNEDGPACTYLRERANISQHPTKLIDIFAYEDRPFNKYGHSYIRYKQYGPVECAAYLMDIPLNNIISERCFLLSETHTFIMHGDDGPAYIKFDNNGNTMEECWYRCGKLHRDDGPAYINLKTMHKAYFIDGVAVEDFCMTKRALK